MTPAGLSEFSFTRADDPVLRRAVVSDLERVSGELQVWSPGAGVSLGGSFAWGEATAWTLGERVVILSDYDLFVSLRGPSALVRLAALRRRLAALAPSLNNPRLDVNLQLAGLASRGWQAPVAPRSLAGPEPSPVAPSSPLGFALHALHGAQLGLLACVPGGQLGWQQARYQLNRCALRSLRAAWNLEAPHPVHQLDVCRDILGGAWGEGLELPIVGLLREALDENPGLRLAGLDASCAQEHPRRWALARRLVELLHERWAWQLSLSGRRGQRAHQRERAKGLVRLAVGCAGRARLPGPTADPHRALLEARRGLLEAWTPAGIDVRWLERGLRGLWLLGLGPRRWPREPWSAWEAGRRGARLPNPLRIVSQP